MSNRELVKDYVQLARICNHRILLYRRLDQPPMVLLNRVMRDESIKRARQLKNDSCKT